MRKFSEFLKLNIGDFIRGLIVAVFAAILVPISQTIESGSLTFDWAAMGKMALAAAIAYLGKNLLTNSRGSFAETDQK